MSTPQSYDRLAPADRLLACRLLHERYKRCVSTSLVQDVLRAGAAAAPARKCTVYFADLSDNCGDLFRNGVLLDAPLPDAQR